MLLIKTRLGPDQYGGTGIFADEDVSSGRIVWQKSEIDLTFTLDEVEKMSEQDRAVIKKHGYPSVHNGKLVIELNADNGRYMNHSENPNIANASTEEECIATRFIRAGEQLTCDYRVIDPDLEYCGSFLKEAQQKKLKFG